MTYEQIEKAAQQYAQRLVNEYDQDIPELSLCDLKFDCQNAFIQGAQVALQNQWVSVDERLPEPDTMCLVFGYKDFGDGNITRYTMMAWYDGEDFTDAYDDRKYHPEKWMAIPLVPVKLNPERP